MSSSGLGVAVCIVSHDSAADLPDCLTAVARLDFRPLEVVVVDCASSDDSVALARRWAEASSRLHVVSLAENVGFAGGMNRALEETTARFVLALNPDARPDPDFVTRLVARAEAHPRLRVGAVTGRLLRPADGGAAPRVLDACGMMLSPTWRHLDRGSNQVDRGQWMRAERVFGATAAASLFVRAALEDVALEGEVFAAEFHSYREDAELCFRLRERGWEVLYEPEARCEHRRRNLPRTRRAMSSEINFHSLKNRYLLRAYHQDPVNLLLTVLPATWRDLLALGWVLTMERSSLPAYGWLWRHRRSILERRRLVQGRRTIGRRDLDRWFLRRSLPL